MDARAEALLAVLGSECAASGVRYGLRIEKGSGCAWSAELRLTPLSGIDGEADTGELYYATGGRDPVEPMALVVAAAREAVGRVSPRRGRRPRGPRRCSTRGAPHR